MKRTCHIIKHHYHQHPTKGLLLVMQTLFLMWSTYMVLIKFQMLDSQSVASKFNNSICFPLSSSSPSSSSSSEDLFSPPNLCNLHFQFKKFVWIYCDGLARDLAEPVLSHLSNSSNIFRVKNEGFPASYAVFSSYVTGKIPANYLGAPVLNDNLLFQFQRAGMRMAYYGTKMPAYDVLKEGGYFDEVIIEAVQVETSTLYETMYNPMSCDSSSDEFCTFSFLNAVRDNGRSVVFSGDVVDERNHITGNRVDPRTLSLIDQFASRMAFIKKWIDENQDYILIVMSDHGGKVPSETETHGRNDGGNEAFLSFYHPSISSPVSNSFLFPPSSPSSSSSETWIDTMDVCGTIWQHFGGQVNIPAESCGKVQVVAPKEDKISSYKTIKLNAIQMTEYANWWNYRIPHRYLYDNAVAMELSDLDSSISLMSLYIEELKEPLINLKRFPVFEIIMYPIVISIILISLVYQVFRSYREFVKAIFSFDFIAIILSLVMAPIGMAAIFSGFWVLWFHNTNLSVHTYACLLFLSLASYYASRKKRTNKTTSSYKYLLTPLHQKYKEKTTTSPIQASGSNYHPFLDDDDDDESNLSVDLGDATSVRMDKISATHQHNSDENTTNSEVEVDGDDDGEDDEEARQTDNTTLSHSKTKWFCFTKKNWSGNGTISSSSSSLSPSSLLIKYAIAVFSMNLWVILQDAIPIPSFWAKLYSICYVLYLWHLYCEFVWQKRLISSFLFVPSSSSFSTKKTATPFASWFSIDKNKEGIVFLPLYSKFVVYLVLLACIIHYDWVYRDTNTADFLSAFIVIIPLFCHTFILFFCKSHIQRDLILPTTLLLFFMSTNKERFVLLCFVLPQYECLSQLLYSRLSPIFQSNGNIISSPSRHEDTIVANKRESIYDKEVKQDYMYMVAIWMMINCAFWNFNTMGYQYDFGTAAIYNPGISDSPTSPLYSAMILTFHHLGYFFLLIAYLIRLVNPLPPLLIPFSFYGRKYPGHMTMESPAITEFKEDLRRFMITNMVMFSVTAVFFYHVATYTNVLTKTFVWTMTVGIVTCFSCLCLLTSYTGYICEYMCRLIRDFYNKK